MNTQHSRTLEPDTAHAASASSQPQGRPWLAHYESQAPPSIAIPELTLHGLFEQTVRDYPSNVAATFFGRRLTYFQLNEQANRFAAALQSMGVGRGERLAILLPNCPQFLVAVFGALKAGVVPVPLDPASATHELQHLLCDSGATTAITLNTSVGRVLGAQAGVPVERAIVTSMQDALSPLMSLMLTVKERREGVPLSQAGEGIYSFAELLRAGTADYLPFAGAPSDTAALLYTAGITAMPKGVNLSHRNLVANALQLSAWLWDSRPERRDVFLAAVPLSHSYGFTAAMNLSISVAGTLVLLPHTGVKDVLAAIARYRPTIFPAVPALCKAIVHHPLAARFNLRSIRVCISGETRLDEEITAAFESVTGARLIESYGLTEVTAVTHCTPVHGEHRAGSTGLPLPGTDACILHPDTHEPLPMGETGELAVRGPQVARCDSARHGDWLLTGDLARMDESGYFYIVARKVDLITLGDHSFFPSEVEDVLYASGKVHEVVVAAVPHPSKGQILKAYVVLKPDIEATERQLKSFAARRLAPHQVPARIEFREALPKNSTGKYLLRELIAGEAAKSAATRV